MRTKRLEALKCEPCQAGEGPEASWARVWTTRGGHTHISELSWPLARRLLPRLLARHGVDDLGGLYWGRVILIRYPR